MAINDKRFIGETNARMLLGLTAFELMDIEVDLCNSTLKRLSTTRQKD